MEGKVDGLKHEYNKIFENSGTSNSHEEIKCGNYFFSITFMFGKYTD